MMTEMADKEDGGVVNEGTEGGGGGGTCTGYTTGKHPAGGGGGGSNRKRARHGGGRNDTNKKGGGGGGKDVMDLFACPPSPDDYIRFGGLRVVRPYPFDFVCHVKKRQEGLDVVDMFAREFSARPRSYYQAAHVAGLLRVEPMPNATTNNKTTTAAVEPLRPLRAGERVRHALHRHEPPSLDHPVTIVAETPDIVAVHKPATVPVHPTGQYRKNTVVGILAAERPDLGRLFPVHRLDKNVSGLLLMARNPIAANSLREQVQGHEVSKEYLALVTARNVTTGASVLDIFHHHHHHHHGDGGGGGGGGGDKCVSVRAHDCNDADGYTVGEAANDHTVTVNAGVYYDERERVATCSTPKAPVEGAKEASTRFTLVALGPTAAAAATAANVNANANANATLEHISSSVIPQMVRHNPLLPPGTALVRCRPFTGRTHQIRVHLSLLGHPIANDAVYGGVHPGDRARGEELVDLCGRLLIIDDDEEKKKNKRQSAVEDGVGGSASVSGFVVADGPLGDGGGVGSSAEWPLCAHCPRIVHGVGLEVTSGGGGGGYAQRPPDLEGIWLHCSEYGGASWSFRCPDPPWVPTLPPSEHDEVP